MQVLNFRQRFGIPVPGGVKYFDVGLNRITDEEAAHWYVKANSAPLNAAEEAAEAQRKADFDAAVESEIARRRESGANLVEDAVKAAKGSVPEAKAAK